MGLTHAYRLARIDHQMGRPCIPHSWTNAVAHAASDSSACLPKVRRGCRGLGTTLETGISIIWGVLADGAAGRVVLETQTIGNPMLTNIVDRPIPVDKGSIDLSQRPGLGIELDEETLQGYPFSENGIFVPWPRG